MERKLAKIGKKLKEESPNLVSPVGGWGFELLDGDGLLDVQSQKIRLMFDGLEVDFWWLFELYLVRLVPWWLLPFLRWLLRWLFLFIVAFSAVTAVLIRLRQDPPPLEAILVIFGLRALIFLFVWKVLEKMKNDATFVRMRSCDHLGDAKMSKRAPRSVEFNFFNNCDRHKRFSQNERRRADLQNGASDFLIFALGLSYDLSKFSDDFTPFFDFERP